MIKTLWCLVALQHHLRIPREKRSALAKLGKKLVEFYFEPESMPEDILNTAHAFWRYGPSVVTRAEIEVLGLSAPRFALRTYLGGETEQFINVRRLSDIRQRLPKDWAPRLAPNDVRDHRYQDFEDLPTPQNWIKDEASPIADSILKFCGNRAVWHVLEVEIGEDYGEPPLLGTPYVQGYAFSGLCAQAACFMANIISLNETKSVHGIAEITMLAGNAREELPLKGLSPFEVTRYFSGPDVDLAAQYQGIAPGSLYTSRTSKDQALLAQRFRESLRAYILSGVPVLVPVDYSRLKREGGAYNRIENTVTKADQQPATGFGPVSDQAMRSDWHFICGVGCHKQIGSDGFLFHDPAYLPFLQLTAMDLLKARTPMPQVDTGPDALQIPPSYLAVTASRVKLLLDTDLTYTNPLGGPPGLREIAVMFQLGHGSATHLGGENYLPVNLPGGISDAYPGEFRLLKLLEDRATTQRNMLAQDIPLRFVRLFCDWLYQSSFSPSYEGRWVWLQFRETCLWVWNAERPALSPETDIALQNLLVFVVGPSRQDANTEITWATPEEFEKRPSLETCDDQPVHERLNLEPCLMTSFSVNGVDSSLAHWPMGLVAAELYAYMHTDLPHFFGGTFVRGASAAFCMANTFRNKDRDRIIRRHAEMLARKFEKRGVEIKAIASFLPELLQPIIENGEAQRSLAHNALPNVIGFGADALDSIRYLLRLGFHLKDFKHNVAVIELVGGPRTAGSFLTLDRLGSNSHKNCTLLVNVPERSRYIRGIEGLLQMVAKEASDFQIPLALEMEPGPLYHFNSLPVMEEIMRQLEAFPFLGLNLDLAHYSLLCGSGITEIFDKPVLGHRFIHTHISRCSKGHLADIALTELPPFLKQCLKRINVQATTSPHSGLVSIELEAAKDANQVAASFEKLRDFLEGR